MPRCGCEGSVCSCRIIEGEGIDVEGFGTPSEPYKITATGGNLPQLLTVQPTPSLALDIFGDGSVGEPLVITGTAELSTLLDVVDPEGAPTNGQVPTWVTDHWEFRTPATGGGTISAGPGITGDGSAGSPVSLARASEITNALDLDNMLNIGWYAQTDNAEAASGTHYPAPYAGMLEVGINQAQTLVTQRYTILGGVQAGFKYERQRVAGVWTAWRLIDGNPALPDPVATLAPTSQSVVALAETELPTAIRATVTNPHPTRLMLVKVEADGTNESTASVAAAFSFFTGVNSVSGSPTLIGDRNISRVNVAANLAGIGIAAYAYGYWSIPSGGTVVFATTAWKTNASGTIAYRAATLNVTPLRYLG